MATLRASNDGMCLNWVNGGYFDASVVESDPWTLYLCSMKFGAIRYVVVHLALAVGGSDSQWWTNTHRAG